MATESSPRPASSPVSPCSWCSELVPDINAHQSSCKMKKALCSFLHREIVIHDVLVNTAEILTTDFIFIAAKSQE